MFFWTSMDHAHLYVIVEIAVVHVRRIVRKQDLRRFRARDQVAAAVLRVGRNVNDLRRVAYGPGRQEEVFIFTFGTVGHRADAETVGEDFRADTAGAIVDGEAVFHTVERVRKYWIFKL